MISRADLTGHFGGRKMDESKITIGDRKSRNSAIAIVVLMLLSSQMYSMMDFEHEDPDESVWGTVPQLSLIHI